MNLPAISLFEAPSLEGRWKKFRPESFAPILAAILEFFWDSLITNLRGDLDMVRTVKVQNLNKRGPGFWKINQPLLYNETYTSLLCVELENFKQK